MRISIGCLIILLAGCATPSVEPTPKAEQPMDTTYLDAAVGSARYVLANELGESGEWRTTDAKDAPVVHHLYSGTSGGVLLLGLLDHAEAAPEPEAYPRSLSALLAAAPKTKRPGLYVGSAGIGYVLLELHGLRPDPRLEQAIGDIVSGIVARAVRNDATAHWKTGTDIISGAAGTGLFLLRAHEQTGNAQALEAAAATGRWLLSQSTDDGDGSKWLVTPRSRRVYPNFSHGTAGVGYFLLRCHGATRDPAFLAGARKAAAYLENTKLTSPGGGCCWRHHEGNDDLLYVSFCHGPAGTARFYRELYRQTGEAKWRQRTIECGEWLLESKIPKPSAGTLPGYWNNSCCCGDAGVADFYLDLYVMTEEQRWLDAAEKMAKHLLGAARRQDGALSWVQAEHRVRPKDKQAQTGWAQGSAGIGLFFLRLHLVKNRGAAKTTWQLPDTPFTSR